MATPPSEQRYKLVLQAAGEVRDADGNLVSSEPVSATMTVTEDQARSLGLITEGESS